MTRNPLNCDSIHQALDELVCAIGGDKSPYKNIGGELWPSKTQDTAYARLKASLDPNQEQKFSPEEMLYLLRRGRQSGVHVLAMYIMQEAGYEIPVPAAPNSPRVEIMERMKALTDEQLQLAKELELLDREEEAPVVASVS